MLLFYFIILKVLPYICLSLMNRSCVFDEYICPYCKFILLIPSKKCQLPFFMLYLLFLQKRLFDLGMKSVQIHSLSISKDLFLAGSIILIMLYLRYLKRTISDIYGDLQIFLFVVLLSIRSFPPRI